MHSLALLNSLNLRWSRRGEWKYVGGKKNTFFSLVSCCSLGLNLSSLFGLDFTLRQSNLGAVASALDLLISRSVRGFVGGRRLFFVVKTLRGARRMSDAPGFFPFVLRQSERLIAYCIFEQLSYLFVLFIYLISPSSIRELRFSYTQ